MSMTDPIADFLTRIRNGIMAAHETVEIPSSRLKKEMARILTEQGYIEGYDEQPGVPGSAADKILVKSNGLVTYAGKDIAYHLWKLDRIDRDFDYTPFVEEGGLGMAGKLFGKNLQGILGELNEALAA